MLPALALASPRQLSLDELLAGAPCSQSKPRGAGGSAALNCAPPASGVW
jgi:hypothetical protein